MRILAMIACVLTLLVGDRVSADSSLFHNRVQDPSPDLVFIFGTLSYDTASDALRITAFPDSINSPAGIVDPGSSPSFVLDAVIPTLVPSDLDGKAITGSLDINGKIPTLGFNSGDLLTGNLTAFRSQSSQQMEFLFTITGGDAATLFGGINAIGFINIRLITPAYDQFFGTNDTIRYLSFSVDTASSTPVPEPASLLMAMLGVVGVAGVHLRRKRPLQVS